MKAFRLTSLGMFLTVVLLRGASFDVASVKLANPAAEGSDINWDNGLVRMRNVTLKRTIMVAFRVPENRIVDGPGWIEDNRYDIDAKPERPSPIEELLPMLQTLLGERFHLSVHHEMRLLSGYALTLAKGGTKARPSLPDAVSKTVSVPIGDGETPRL